MATPDDPRPLEPAPPDLGECCGSGCDPCIFDVYDAALERFRAELRAWTARQNAAVGGGNEPAES